MLSSNRGKKEWKKYFHIFQQPNSRRWKAKVSKWIWMNNGIIWRLSRREEEWNEDGGLSHIHTAGASKSRTKTRKVLTSSKWKKKFKLNSRELQRQAETVFERRKKCVIIHEMETLKFMTHFTGLACPQNFSNILYYISHFIFRTLNFSCESSFFFQFLAGSIFFRATL